VRSDVENLVSSLGKLIQVRARFFLSFSIFSKLARAVFIWLNKSAIQGLPLEPLESRGELKHFRLMIVVPQSWHPTLREWGPGVGHFYYDLWKSAEERYGASNVCRFQIEPEDQNWAKELRQEVIKSEPSHILMHIEEIPNGNLRGLLEFASSLRQVFQGWVTLLMYDSIFWNHLFAAELFSKAHPNTAVIATDQFPSIARVQQKTGPALLPTSQASLSALETKHVENQNKYGLTLIGKVYGYRAKALKRLVRKGVFVEVNPHRAHGSIENPSYLSFYSAFRDSWATVNFSRANGSHVKHAKTRILEATLFGSLLVTDEYELTSQLLGTDSFVYFRNAKELKQKIEYLKADPESYSTIRKLGYEAAKRLRTNFWVKFDKLHKESADPLQER
jgi:hypothetical protein